MNVAIVHVTLDDVYDSEPCVMSYFVYKGQP